MRHFRPGVRKNNFSLVIMRQRKWLCEIEKFWISKSNCTILMKIHIHNIYITYKIVYKSGAECYPSDSDTSYSCSQEITIWKKVKKMLTSNISESYGPIISPKNSIKSYPKSTSTRNFEEIKTILHP